MTPSGVKHLLDPEGMPLFSLMDINRLAVASKEKVYGQLIPDFLLERFSIDRHTYCGEDGEKKVRFICPDGLGLLRIEIRLHPGDRDPVYFLELADTHFGQMELSFCLINDPAKPRFNIDQDENGHDNYFGTIRRNISEEIKAMSAGLSPNQVRSGMKMFSDFFRRFESFVNSLGIGMIVAEPLSYNNAIRYERYGFDYISGKQLMLWINREFQPGGLLYNKLDGSTPFRQPGMEKSVRGRSWAIHDGILDRPWDGVKIYKIPGEHAGVDTFPNRTF